MNFTTDLPKKRPYVTYIVASAVKCERFFPNSKDEGPSYRMHAVILNKERVHSQKYKSKTQSHSAHMDTEDSNQSLSSTCSSAESVDAEKSDELLDAKHIQKSKNYILCHIRKIDSNYKASRSNGKRDMSSREEEEAEDQNDEEEGEEEYESEDPLVKKLFCAKAIQTVKEKTVPETEKEIAISKLTPLKVVSTELVRSRSEATSPQEPLIPKQSLTSPILAKSPLFSIGSKNSAFNSFQSPILIPRLSPILKPEKSQEIVIKVKTEDKKPKSPVTMTNSTFKKSLFEAFSLADSTNIDYLQLFSSLINPRK